MNGILDLFRQELVGTLKPNQCTIMAHRIIQNSAKGRFKTSNKSLSKAPIAYTCLDQDPELIKTEFDNLLASCYSSYIEKMDIEENKMLA